MAPRDRQPPRQNAEARPRNVASKSPAKNRDFAGCDRQEGRLLCRRERHRCERRHEVKGASWQPKNFKSRSSRGKKATPRSIYSRSEKTSSRRSSSFTFVSFAKVL